MLQNLHRSVNAVRQIHHALSHLARTSTKSIHLQVSTRLLGLTWPCCQLVNQVRLLYLLPAAVGTICSLLVNPCSRCHMADSFSTELKAHGASRSAGGRSKNKTLAFRVRCRGRRGFPHHLKMQPPPVVRRRFYLGGCLMFGLVFAQFVLTLGKILKTAGLKI